jgi:hypothetical protein
MVLLYEFYIKTDAAFLNGYRLSCLWRSVFFDLLYLFPLDWTIAAGTISRVIFGPIFLSLMEGNSFIWAARPVCCNIFPFHRFHNFFFSLTDFHCMCWVKVLYKVYKEAGITSLILSTPIFRFIWKPQASGPQRATLLHGDFSFWPVPQLTSHTFLRFERRYLPL